MRKRDRAEFNKRPLHERARYYAGGRPTVGTIEQVEDHGIAKSYVGKLRSVIISDPNSDIYKFKTPEEALACAVRFRDRCREIAGIVSSDR